MRRVTVFLDEARYAAAPGKAVWAVDVELELDGTVTQETWRRVANAEIGHPIRLLGRTAGESGLEIVVG